MGWAETIGGIAGGANTALGMAFNAKEAKKQRKFTERMYKNRYQYTMADMKTAGLNPILAYKGIGGNSPSGASATMPGGQSAVSSALEAKRTSNETSTKSKQREHLQSGIELNSATAAKANADAEQSRQAAELSKYQQKGQSLANTRQELDMQAAANRSAVESTWWGKMMKYIQPAAPIATGGAGLLYLNENRRRRMAEGLLKPGDNTNNAAALRRKFSPKGNKAPGARRGRR